jgi:hypothetical protein
MYGNTRMYTSNRASRAPVKRAAPKEIEDMNKIHIINLEGDDVVEVKIDGVLTQMPPGTAQDFDVARGAAVSVFVTDPEAAKGEFPKDLADASNGGGGDGSGD